MCCQRIDNLDMLHIFYALHSVYEYLIVLIINEGVSVHAIVAQNNRTRT